MSAELPSVWVVQCPERGDEVLCICDSADSAEAFARSWDGEDHNLAITPWAVCSFTTEKVHA